MRSSLLMIKKRNFDIVRQHDSMDCAAASLGTVCNYYGKKVDLNTLREKTYLSKEGASLLGLSDAAENIGFKTIAGRFTIQELKEKIPLPCIIHWNQEHFMVLYKYKGGKFYLADPAEGFLKLKESTFELNWLSTKSKGEDKGIALLLEPTPNFYDIKIEKSQGSKLRFLFFYFKQYKKYLFQLFLGVIISSLIQIAFPFLTQAIVDIGIKDKSYSFIFLILIAQLALFTGRLSIELVRRWILLHISTRINLSLLSDFFIKLMKLPMSWFDSKLIGDITQRVGDHSRIEKFLTVHSLSTIFSAISFLIFGIILLYYSLSIFIIFLIGSVLYISWIFIFLSRRKSIDYEFFRKNAEVDNNTFQLITGMQEIKLQNCEKQKRWEWEDLQADLFKTSIKSLSLEQYQEVGNFFIGEARNIIITVLAASAVIDGTMTLGMMLAVQYIIGQLNGPIEQAIQFIRNLQDMRISLERVNDIHNHRNENDNKNEKIDSLKSDIILKNVFFSYDNSEHNYVLQNINLTIKNGETTAIVGLSGSGKTTLIKLLLQYYSASKGSVLLNNQSLQHINTKLWRNRCGSVMQDGFIFSDTIANNISVSDETPNKDKLLKAIKLANLEETINSLPLKYNTKIGMEGKGLSKGQIQRILIARAIYKDPDFLFFDEATNALDTYNEKIIVNNINSFFENKTVVVVAHRLSTVKNANKIIVLDSGRIVEVGDHSTLIAKKGFYYKLVRNQLEISST